MGYHRAGFDVVGADIAPQPNYPFQFYRCDVFEFFAQGWRKGWVGSNFEAIHASPPCQAFTAYRRKGHGVGDGYEDLIAPTRELLRATGLPWVIENVPGAPLESPIKLCGSAFGLDVRRHRLFETNWNFRGGAPCQHHLQVKKGKRFPGATNRNGRYTCEIGVWRIPLEVQQKAMGIDWMTLEELSEAIPPAYTEFVGRQLLRAL